MCKASVILCYCCKVIVKRQIFADCRNKDCGEIEIFNKPSKFLCRSCIDQYCWNTWSWLQCCEEQFILKDTDYKKRHERDEYTVEIYLQKILDLGK
jgi:hypothetical protein